MPLSSVLGASSVIKPGVCTSTTRPTVPYEGQLIYETDTDRVAAYNGSAWVYKTPASHRPGIVLVQPQTSFTSVSAVNVDNVFSSLYDDYQIHITISNSTVGTGLNLRMRGSGTTASGNDYYGYTTGTSPSGTSDNYSSSGISSHVLIGLYGASPITHMATVRIHGPFLAVRTMWRSDGYGYTASGGNMTYQGGSNHNLATSYDGFTLLPGSGNITGTYTVYGFEK